MSNRNLLQDLADKQAITDLIYRYCRAVDRIDEELGYSIWNEDATADYGERIYRGSGRGVIDFICASHRTALCQTHQISNIIIQLDGDRAGSEAYVASTTRYMQEKQLKQISVWGRYIDRWSRRNGHWGIDARVFICDMEELRDVAASTQLSDGRTAAVDPSYAVLQGAS